MFDLASIANQKVNLLFFYKLLYMQTIYCDDQSIVKKRTLYNYFRYCSAIVFYVNSECI